MSIDFRGLWLLSGAWAAAWFLPPPWVLVLALVSIGFLFALAARRRHDPSYSAPWFAGPLLLLTAGAAVMTVNLGSTPCQIPQQDSTVSRVIWQFSDTPRSSDNQTVKGRGTITQHWYQGHWSACPIQVFITSEQQLPARTSQYESLMRLEPTGSRAGIQYWATVAGAAKTHEFASASRTQSIKDGFAASVAQLPESAKALLPGMLYGDRSLQDEELTDAMKATGLSHLTAVSGSNCAIVGGIVMFIFRALGANRVLVLAGLGTSLLLFAILVGPEPSVLRAAVMGATAAISLHFGRGRASLGILCLSATLLLLISPALAAEAAFALSVLATLGIIVFAPLITDFISHAIPRWLAEPIAICTAAQLSCLPVIVALSENFSLYSIPLNLMVTALIPVITILGILCVSLVLAFPGLVSFLVWIPGVPAWGIGDLALWAATWPGAQRPWPSGGGGVALAVGFSLGLGVLILVGVHGQNPWLRRVISKSMILVLVLLCAVVLPATSLFRPALPPWHLAMCDVGQGDAFVIRVEGSTGWLIDTGSAESGLLQCLDSLKIERLERVFITHSHEDHMGALAELLASSIEVQNIMVSTAEHRLTHDRQLQSMTQGQSLSSGPVRLTVLGPKAENLAVASINDTSLVLHIELKIQNQTYTFVAAGDMEQRAMQNLLDSMTPQPLTVLKASHHGARNGGTEILEHFSPRLLLISVGARNSYGHPHDVILEAAASQGTEVIRSDIHGTVTITFDRGQAIATRIGAGVR